MNNRYSMSMALVVLFACVPMRTDANISLSTTGDEIPDMLATQYNALSKKWAPLFNNVSQQSVDSFLDSWAKELQWKMASSYDRHVDQECGSLFEEMSAWPYEFVREELVRDIRSLAALEHEARTLGLSHCVNDTFLRKMQDLRVQVAELPEYRAERESLSRTRKIYHASVVAVATATIGYIAKYGEEKHYPLSMLAGFAGFVSFMDLVSHLDF